MRSHISYSKEVDAMSRKTILIAGSVLTVIFLITIGGLTAAGIREIAKRSAASAPSAESTEAAVESVESVESKRAPVKPSTVTLLAGTVLRAELQQTISSERSSVGQPFWLRTEEPVMVGRRVAIPVGSRVYGEVVESKRSGRVKGRARLMLAFRRIETKSGGYSIAAQTVTRVAQGTKKRDAAIIGAGAGIGAVVGALAGGGKGAAIGAGVGGGAGTGVVLVTRGKEVQFARGETIAVKLVEPVVMGLN